MPPKEVTAMPASLPSQDWRGVTTHTTTAIARTREQRYKRLSRVRGIVPGPTRIRHEQASPSMRRPALARARLHGHSDPVCNTAQGL
jgi:hypothetical protein